VFWPKVRGVTLYSALLSVKFIGSRVPMV